MDAFDLSELLFLEKTASQFSVGHTAYRIVPRGGRPEVGKVVTTCSKHKVSSPSPPPTLSPRVTIHYTRKNGLGRPARERSLAKVKFSVREGVEYFGSQSSFFNQLHPNVCLIELIIANRVDN